MIFNSGSNLSPKVFLRIGNVEVDYARITGVELDLCVNEHDLLTIRMNGIPSKAITDYISAPIEFTLSSGPGRSQNFYGYVLYVEPEYSSSSPIVNEAMFYTAKIVCFGASVSMKNTTSRVWGSTTIYRVAQELAEKYEFSLSCIKDPFVIPNLVQSNESDWEMLVRVCETYGYSMTTHGTHLNIWDPFRSIGRRQSYEALIPQNAYSGPIPGGILEFKGTFGQLTPEGESYRYEVTSLDDAGRIVTVSEAGMDTVPSWSGYATPSAYTSNLSANPSSVEEAEKIIEAERKKNFPFNAEVRISAGAGVIPGGVVTVNGYESNFEGVWYVTKVKHTIGGSSYYTDLLVSRDYNLTESFFVTPTTLAETPPESQYRDNKWVTTQQKVDLYV